MLTDASIHLYPSFGAAPTEAYICAQMCQVLLRDGISHALVLEDFDPASEFFPEFFLNAEISRKSLQKALGGAFSKMSILHSGVLPLRSVMMAEPYLQRLTLGADRLLPISIPGGCFSAEEETAYGYLLKHRVTPLLVHFEEACLLASPKEVDRLIHLPHAVYLLSPKAFELEVLFPVWEKMIALRREMVLGSCARDPSACQKLHDRTFVSSRGKSLYSCVKRFSTAYFSKGVFD